MFSSLGITFASIRAIFVMLLDIFVMWLILYYTLRLVRSNSRTIQIFKGVILVIVIDAIAKLFGLKTLEYFTAMFINWGFLAIIIIFQPEIRTLLERIGKSNVFSRITTLSGSEKENLVDQIVTAVMLLSKDQTGALISIEQSHPMNEFIATGTKLNADVSAELLTSIFVTSTPLHDGAVILQGDKIACASAYFPPTNLDLPSRYGARHRAAIGISEISDCVTIVVSEETGSVSITEGGRITVVDREQLRNYLLRVICGITTEVKGTPTQRKQKKQDKAPSVLSKLAIKKQSEPVSEKVHVEEVKPAAQLEVQQTATQKLHQEADREAKAAEIKLPHKKKRPAPSYPTQKEHKIPQVAQQPRKRMTPEEVEAARQASIESLRTKPQTTVQTPILDDEERKYDTSKLDITKIVGFNDELDKQFEMVDGLDHKKTSSQKGGE